MFRNTLYYGDNLDVMREFIPDESVDLVYLDPPFNSARDYNVLFKQAKRDENQAQMTAFTDTWLWSKKHYQEFFDDSRNVRLFDLMSALHKILGQSEMMAYLVMMAPRLLELRRALKPTGSFYLHCDPSASHYLKLVLDVVFGPTNFRNEVVWQRTSSHNDPSRYGRIHDTLLFYTRGREFVWNPQYEPQDDRYYGAHDFELDEEGRKFRKRDLTAPSHGSNASGQYEWKGRTPPDGRMWSYTQDNMQRLEEEGRIVYTSTGMPRLKIYIDDLRGAPLQDIWARPELWLNSGASERMGYPTQKPLALLERIINTSSAPDGVVLDPFCGCGTAVVAAERLRRRWIGIDITYVSIDLIIERLSAFEPVPSTDYEVKGVPKDAHSARKLFEESPKQFEQWAVMYVDGVPQPDKSGDRGIDGKVYFQDLESNLQCAVCQVKGGHLTPSLIRDFSHVIEREKAAIGYFICLEKPTKGMYNEAEEIGFFTVGRRKIPKLQVRTIKELLEEGKQFERPEGYALKSASGNRLTRDKEQRKLEL